MTCLTPICHPQYGKLLTICQRFAFVHHITWHQTIHETGTSPLLVADGCHTAQRVAFMYLRVYASIALRLYNHTTSSYQPLFEPPKLKQGVDERASLLYQCQALWSCCYVLHLQALPHDVLYSNMVWRFTTSAAAAGKGGLPYHRFRQGDSLLITQDSAGQVRGGGAASHHGVHRLA